MAGFVLIPSRSRSAPSSPKRCSASNEVQHAMNASRRQAGPGPGAYSPAACVTLLVIAALVIDLGFAFMIRRRRAERRRSGAIAAARYIRTVPGRRPSRRRCVRQPASTRSRTGSSRARRVTYGCIPANDPNGTVLTVNYPPSAGGGTFVGTDGYVEVGLSRIHRSFLAGIVGLDNFRVSTSAVAAFTIGQFEFELADRVGSERLRRGSNRTHPRGRGHEHPCRSPVSRAATSTSTRIAPAGRPTPSCSNGSGALKIDGGTAPARRRIRTLSGRASRTAPIGRRAPDRGRRHHRRPAGGAPEPTALGLSEWQLPIRHCPFG